MNNSIPIIIGAFSLGFFGGAIPGPVLTGILTEILETSFVKSMRVLFFAMIIETFVRLFALSLADFLPVDGIVFQAISVIGAIVLLRVGTKVWRIRGISVSGMTFSFKALALMIICNGMLWIYWLTVCVPDAILLGAAIPHGQYLFLFIFETGWFCSTFLVALIFSVFKNLLSHPCIMPFVFKCFAFVFFGFALKMLAGSSAFFMR